MDRSYLEKLKELAAKATPGPWERAWEHEGMVEIYPIQLRIEKDWIARGNRNEENDVDFICEARTAIPLLLAEIERLDAMVQELDRWRVGRVS